MFLLLGLLLALFVNVFLACNIENLPIKERIGFLGLGAVCLLLVVYCLFLLRKGK